MKVGTRLFISCLALIGTLGLSAFAMIDDPFAALLKKLEEFSKKYPQEKIHIHLDKPYYAIGDDIWFKVYTTDARTSAPTTLSKIVYVELIDENDSLRTQLKLPMQGGISWGDIKLSDTLGEGNYRLRAYTQLMRNAGPDFFFDKTLKIGNSWANKVFVRTDYQLSKERSDEKVSGTIRFTDKTGNAFANTEVTYKVELGSRIVTRGKAVTNGAGEINIPISNKQPDLYKSGRITATITLADKQEVTKRIPLKSPSTSVDVQFFPESGFLMQGLTSRVAFKAVNAHGKGENCKGVIIDSDGAEITTFESTHLGMGSFFLSPAADKTYRAKIKFGNGNEKVFDLPKIESSGYVLSVNHTDTTKVVIKVLATEDRIAKEDLNLLAQQNGRVYFAVRIPIVKNLAITSLPRSELPSGIITLTLFTGANIPVAERLIFNDSQNDKIKIDVGNLQKVYAKREAMKLDLLTMNKDLPTRGSFSVSVTNTAAVEPDLENETNIFTSLLLKSDLKGYIEKPNHYFIDNGVKGRQDLDHLLLTQGWRKIDWKEIGNDISPLTTFQHETDLKISGTITTNSGKPVPNGKVSLFSSSRGVFTVDTLSDANGKFNFDGLEFTDSARFVIQARNEKGKREVRIKLDVVRGQFVTLNKNTGDIEVNVNEQLKNYLQHSDGYFDELTKKGMLKHTIQLKEVRIIGKKAKVEFSDNLNGPGFADIIITAKDLEDIPVFSLYVRSKVTGIKVKDGFAYKPGRNSGPMITFIDGMYMEGMLLEQIPVSLIETVEILKSVGNTFVYGERGKNGVLVVTTKRGGATTYAPGIIIYNQKGYSVSRQFYSPRHNDALDPKPDLRTAVYWNPSVVSDEKGNVKLDYFNTDEAGLYRVVIEGIDVMGNLARRTFTYQVK